MSERGTITTFLRTESDGEGGVRRFYRCETCHGVGQIGSVDSTIEPDDCPDCDGLGEWFE